LNRLVLKRSTLIALMVTGLAVAVVTFLVARTLGDPFDPLSLDNKALLAGLVGLGAAISCEVIAMLGNHCPACRAEMKYIIEDGGRVGINVKVLDVFARKCPSCGHIRN
jgi:hypothetical protein